jgi:hypothetical protein
MSTVTIPRPDVTTEQVSATLRDGLGPQLGLTDPARTAAAWAAVDRRLTAAAAWVPIVSLRDVKLTSPRLGNYQYNPVWHIQQEHQRNHLSRYQDSLGLAA